MSNEQLLALADEMAAENDELINYYSDKLRALATPSPQAWDLRGEMLEFITETPEDVTHKHLVSLGWTPPQVPGGEHANRHVKALRDFASAYSADDDIVMPAKLYDEINASGDAWKQRAERAEALLQARPDGGEGITWPVWVLEMRKEGWTFKYEPATKFVGANHPMGGKQSVLSFNRHSYADQMGEAIAASMNAAHAQARPDGVAVDEVLMLCPKCGAESYVTPHEELYTHPAQADVARLVEAASVVAAAQDGAFSSEWDELDKAVAPFTTGKQRGSDGESVPDVRVQGEDVARAFEVLADFREDYRLYIPQFHAQNRKRMKRILSDFDEAIRALQQRGDSRGGEG